MIDGLVRALRPRGNASAKHIGPLRDDEPRAPLTHWPYLPRQHPRASMCAILLWLLVVAGGGGGGYVAAQTSDVANRPVNVFVINDAGNDVANKSVTNSLRALKEKNADKLGKVYVAQVNVTDSKETLNVICETWKSAINAGAANVPDFVLDTTTYGVGAETVNRFTALLGIPTLSAQFGQEGDLLGWREISEDQKQYLVQVMNPADLMPEVVREQCSHFNISNAAILFDESFVMDHKYKSLLLNVPTRHVIVPAKAAGTALRDQISRLRDLDIVNFFVLGSEATISAALQAASSLDFTDHRYGWFGVNLNEDFAAQCPDCPRAKLMIFKPAPSPSQQQLSELTSKGALPRPWIQSAFYYDLARIGVLGARAAIEAGEWRTTTRTYRDCDGVDENSTVPARNFDFRKRLQQVTSNASAFVPTYASFAWGRNGESQAKFEVNGVATRIKDSRVTKEDTVETWQAGIDVPLNIKNEELAQNQTAVTSYRVVTVIKPPFVTYDNKTGKWSGYCIDLLDKIREHVPFEYTIEEVADKEYGNMDEQGNWNGMVKVLKDKKADIGLGALAVMAERENVIDYTVPYYDLVGISILRKKPRIQTSLFKFLTVLETDVWLCILGAYFFTSLLMWVFDKFSPYSYQNNREKYKNDDEKREFTLKECLWFCMTSLTPQGGGEAPKNLSGRLVAATWWLFGFIIIASYTANLAAFLTVSRLDAPIESLEDLSKQYKIQYAPVLNSSEYRYFERMAAIEKRFYEIWKDMSLNDSLSDVERSKLAVWDYPVSDKYTKIFQTMQDAVFPKSKDEALERVRKSDPTEFAFIGDATDIKYLVMTNCEFTIIGEEFSRKPYAIAVQQGSPLKDQFNNAILLMLNRRELEKLKDTWWNKNPERKSCTKEDDQSDGISIQNIGGVFIVIFVGIGLACVTLVFEYYYYRYRPQARMKHQREQQQQQLNRRNNNAPKNPVASIGAMKFNLRPAPTQNLEPNNHRF